MSLRKNEGNDKRTKMNLMKRIKNVKKRKGAR